MATLPGRPTHQPAAPAAALTLYGDPQPLLPPPDVTHETVFGCCRRVPFADEVPRFELLLLHHAVARPSAPQPTRVSARGSFTTAPDVCGICHRGRGGKTISRARETIGLC